MRRVLLNDDNNNATIDARRIKVRSKVIPVTGSSQFDEKLDHVVIDGGDGIETRVTQSEKREFAEVEELDYDEFEEDINSTNLGEQIEETVTTPRSVQDREVDPADHEILFCRRSQEELNDENIQRSLVRLLKDPNSRSLVKGMISDLDQDESTRNKVNTPNTPNRKKQNGEQVINKKSLPLTPVVIKSPSDTTIYAPTLNKILTNNVTNDVPVNRSQGGFANQISNFIEGIRLQDEQARRDPVMETETQRQLESRRNSSDPIPHHSRDTEEEARLHANHMVIEAEKYKAAMVNPAGMIIQESIHKPEDNFNQSKSDDDFFHLTCHIDSNIREKIEKGDFVDLEKLLP